MSKKSCCGNHNDVRQKRAAKKAVVLGENKTKSLRFLPLAILAAIALGGGAAFFSATGDQQPVATSPAAQTVSQTQTASSEPVSGQEVAYPIQMFENGEVKHFSYQHGAYNIKYFVLKSSDGVIRAAFDACDVCWPAGKGYYQQGDDMICRNCGRRFASVLINEVKGGCNPAPLQRQIVGDNLVIKVAEIIEGKQYFDFTKKG